MPTKTASLTRPDTRRQSYLNAIKQSACKRGGVHTRSFIRCLPLLLMLAIGPVHAQTLFACAMMDMVVHETCCCDDHDAYAGSDCDDAMATENGSCCEKSVELSIDQGSDQTAAISKPAEVRSDVDPPAATLVATTYAAPVCGAAVIPCQRADSAHQPGSQTYLVTQRLRI
jgi:hypothetical protein